MAQTSDIKTVSDLIDAFGGAAAFARLIGKEPSTASEMKRSGSVNVRYWPTIIAGARARGDEFAWVTSEALMMMHAPEKPSGTVQPASAGASQ